MADQNNGPELADEALESLFAQARVQPPQPTADLQARILEDAMDVQAALAAAPVVAPEPEAGLMQRIAALFGGWPALGGMVTASLLGIWIGAAPPAFLPDAASLLNQGAQNVDVFDSYEMAVAWSEDG